ncbi:MAG: Flp family type IVb pilin [Solirubrobacteraceae bacterium]
MVSIYVRLQFALSRVLDAQDGQEAVEYALVLFFLVFVILVATRFLGTKVTSAFFTVANSI